ncbi:MAG: RNA methyltransferase [Chlorobiaceae bacterium]|nr:RNA methyltransferase [Chlorobiaceae bacterium]
MKNPGTPAVSKARFKRYLKLHQKKYRESEGLFLAEGLRTVRELCMSMPSAGMLEALLVRDGSALDLEFAAKLKERIFSMTETECSRLAGTSTSQGIIGIFRKPDEEPGGGYGAGKEKTASFIIAFDDVQDPGNAGTIMRTAAWFGCDALVWSSGSADPYNAKSVRSSAGSIFALRHYQAVNLHDELERLAGEGYTIVAASLDGRDFRDFTSWPAKLVLVIGNEANGVSGPVRETAHRMVRIPHGGGKPRVESLNASVSAAILIERLLLG